MTLVFGWWVIWQPTWSSAENYLAFISRSITLKVGTSTLVKSRSIKAQVFPGCLAVGSFLAKDVRKQFHHMMTSLAGGDLRCRFRDGKGAVCLIMQHQNKTVSDKSCQTVYVHKTEDSDEANMTQNGKKVTPISSSANPWNVQWILAWRYKSCRLRSQAFAQSKARDPTSKCHNQPGGLATEIVCQHNSNSMRTPLTFIKINVDQCSKSADQSQEEEEEQHEEQRQIRMRKQNHNYPQLLSCAHEHRRLFEAQQYQGHIGSW